MRINQVTAALVGSRRRDATGEFRDLRQPPGMAGIGYPDAERVTRRLPARAGDVPGPR
jgi:hypothetical protein